MSTLRADSAPLAHLGRLQQIDLPPPVGMWPPAPGWWAVLGLGLVVLAVLWLVRRRRGALVRAAMAELDRIAADPGLDLAGLATELNLLMRRIALVRHPRAEMAALCGERWLEHLARTSGARAFVEGPGRAFATLPYGGDGFGARADQLVSLAGLWIRQNAGKGGRP